MTEQSKKTISTIIVILTTISAAILSIQTITYFVSNDAEGQQQQQQASDKSNKTKITTVQDQNKSISGLNQKAIQEVINATRNTNATGVLAGQIMNATKGNLTNEQTK